MTRTSLVIVMMLSLMIAGSLGYFYMQGGLHIKAPGLMKKERAAQDIPALEKKFEDFLNNLLRDLNTKVREYKEDRKVLDEFVAPENLRNRQYIEQNVAIMHEVVADLQEKRLELMKVFPNADRAVDSILKQEPGEVRIEIAAKWKALRREQAIPYTKYLMIESEVIRAYQNLMMFYFMRQDSFSYEGKENTITFLNEEDAAEVARMQLEIETLRALQKEVLEEM